MVGRNRRAVGTVLACGRKKRAARLQSMARKSLVAFLTFLLAFGTTPAQLWAEGAEGLVQAAASAEETSSSAVAATGDGADGEASQPQEQTTGQPDSAGAANAAAGDADAAGADAGASAATSDDTDAATSTDPDASADASRQAAASDATEKPESREGQTPADDAEAAAPSEDKQTVTATAQVIGVDAEGAPQAWTAATPLELPEGATAADLFVALQAQAGFTASYRQEDDGYFSLDSVTSPYDGRTLAYNPDTWDFWQFFYNGASSDTAEYQTELKDGDTVTWYYSQWGANLPDLKPSDPGTDPGDQAISASIEVIGADAKGKAQRWTALTSLEMPAGSTAADLSEALFKQAGMTADYGIGSWGWSLNTITSPLDGRTIGYDAETGKYWQLFVNGASSSLGAGSVELKQGDAVAWVYSAYGEDKPEVGDIVVNPEAPRPDWQPTWPGFTTSNEATDAKTPTSSVEGKWTLDLDGRGSDPIYVGAYVYVAAGSKLLQIDPKTGAVVSTGSLQTSIDTTARMVYADGVIVVPLHGGRLQALTADTLTTVWVTGELDAEQQSLGTLTVRDGYVYAGTSDQYGTAGYLTCVSLADGSVRWSNGTASGFYWTGSTSIGDYLVTGNDQGEVYAFDPATGKTAGTPLDLGSPVRSTLVSDGSKLYAVTKDGVLHKLSVGDDGTVTEEASVSFGKGSTSTPTLVDGKLIVGGQSATQGPSKWMKYGALFVIDAATMSVEREIVQTADGGYLPTGESKSAPLVSVQADGTYVYFTVNGNPGGVYRYKLGSDAAELIYAPDEAHQNYCMNSVIAGPDGTLYYVNDSGALFAVGSTGSEIDPTPKPATAALSVSNTVKGSQSAQQHAFSYTVELRGTGAAEVAGTYGNFEFKEGVASFTLTGGQSKRAADLPAGLSYIVSQEAADGFTSSQTAFEGVLKAHGSFAADFVNTQVSKTAIATLRVVGVDDPAAQTPVEQNWVPLTQVSFKTDSDTTAWDVFKAALDKAGCTYDAQDSEYGVYVASITSPDGRKLENTAQAPYSYWTLFVNGDYASVGASSYYLKDGDTVEFRYVVANKTPVPEVKVDPDAVGPDWESDWPGYTTAGTATDAKTPSGAVRPSWVVDDMAGYPSDPLVVNGRLYVASGSKLYVKSAKDGKTLVTGQLAAGVDSIARMVYADGLIVVPLSGGRLQALTADTLTTKWVTEALAPTAVEGKKDPYDQQALTTLTVRGGYVYFGTAAADWSASYGGWLACVNLANGATVWTRENKEAGYYWSGAASVGDYLAIAGDDGVLQAIDPATGEVVDSLGLGAAVRSTVTADGSTAYVVTTDGTLHRVTVAADGSLAQTGSVRFGFSSTSTPSLADGKLIVGGTSQESYQNAWGGTSHYGALFIIDAKTLNVERVVTSYASGKFAGDVKSAPLVSVQAEGTYVYFTVNARPGGVYRYKLGEDRAQLVYAPDADHQNYSMSSIVCDAAGNLYYVNDSGALFALTSADSGSDDLPWTDDDGSDDNNGGSNNNGSHDDGSHNAGGDQNGAAPSGKRPLGTVAPGSKPLTDAQKKAAEATEGAQDKDEDGKGEDAQATSLSASTSAKPRAQSATSAAGTPIAALVAGVGGVLGLITAGIWSVSSKRRR